MGNSVKGFYPVCQLIWHSELLNDKNVQALIPDTMASQLGQATEAVRMICWQFTVFIHLYRKQNSSFPLAFCPESSHGMEMSSKKYSIFWCLHWTDTLLTIVIFLIFRWTLLSSKGSYTIIIWSIAIKFLPLEGTASNLSFYAICERVTTFYRWASYAIWDFQAMSNARVTQTRFMTS